MNKKLRKLTILLVMAALLFGGCGLIKQPIPVDNPTTQEPQGSSTDLYPASQEIEGGSEQSGLNLSDIQIKTVSEEQVQLELTFMSGNASMNMSESPSKGIPKYKMSHYEGVDRMVIRLEGLAYWTYRIYQEELQNPIIQGVFHQEPVDSNYTYIYVNTQDDYTYKTEEVDNRLVITIDKVAQESNKNFYVTLNAFSEYENGAIQSDSQMTPSLCDNGENIILISPPMATKAEAEKFLEDHRGIFNKVAASKELQVVELENNQLPTYNEDMLYRLAHYPIGQQDGMNKTFEALTVNGRFLCWNSIYDQYAFVKPFVIEGAQEGDVYKYDQLWHGSKVSEEAPLTEAKLDSLLVAEYSYRSDYVAFIDQNKSMRMLNILSVKDGKLFVPSEDGFGIDTASFVWAEDSNVLYAITGENDSKQLQTYDMTNPNDVKVGAIVEQEFAESALAMDDGYIYYSRRGPEDISARIYQLNTRNGRTKEIAQGFSFKLSPDGQSLLIYDIEEKDDSEEYRLYSLDIATKEQNIIHTGQNSIEDYIWSREGKRVYYTIFRNAGWEAQYPSALYYYDVNEKKSVYKMDMISGGLYPADKDDEVLVMCLYTEQNKSIPVTYIVK